MKRTLLILALLVSSLNAIADGHHGGHHGGGDWWIAPAIIGGAAAITYGLTRPAPPPQPYYPPYTAYPAYHYEWIFDPYCQCQRQVLMPNY